MSHSAATEIRGTPTQPDLKPRRGLLWVSLALFVAWLGLLLALYARASQG